MVFKKTTDYLDSLINYEQKGLPYKSRTFKLSRVKKLLKTLNHPEKNFSVIHIAGTKGKGSTAAFAAYILREAGLKVGLYTSPHLFSRRERIRILKPNVSKSKLCSDLEGCISEKSLNIAISDILEKAKEESIIAKKRISFFEFFTILAFYYFAQQKIDVAVVEVGLGGRLDATNVLDSDICGITPIGLEHTEQLGNSILEIAQEKAAIIKNQTKMVVVSPQKKQALDAIKKQAQKTNTPILVAGKDFTYKLLEVDIKKQTFCLSMKKKKDIVLCTQLLGSHQIVNASVAAVMVQYFLSESFKNIAGDLSKNISCLNSRLKLQTRAEHLSIIHSTTENLEKYIVDGIKNTCWPARFEILSKRPFVVVDSAHTKDSAQKLVEAVRSIFPKQKVILVLGASRDKDVRGICSELKSIAKEIILTKSKHPRAFLFSQDFSKKLFSDKEIVIEPNAKTALAQALSRARKRDVVLVAGSVFLAAEIRRQLIKG
ncbi:MAG: bifunctional folylpolyglutamate synthase/dihydrofolate synthase [Candidatus Omnitrophica bacterium]|nr:bifunctional folylpolyglutamate synthase/dihydrofolate synthase [Candidatus Omnitrophota bacterium]